MAHDTSGISSKNLVLKSLRASTKPLISLTETQKSTKTRLEATLAKGDLKLIEVDCISGTRRSDAILIGQRDRYGFSIFTYLCPKSGILWASPIFDLSSQSKFYNEFYRELYFSASKASDSFFKNQTLEGAGIYSYVSSAVPKESTSLTVLEVGCGAGGVLKKFHELGWKTAGCDLGDKFLERGRQEGLELRLGTSEVLNDLSGADLLIARHVLEHTFDPLQEMKNWASLLKPGGLMFIEVPGTMRALNDYRVIGRFFHIAHTYHFTLKSLEWLASQCGLELVKGDESLVALFRKVETQPTVSCEGEATRIVQYLKKWDSNAMRLIQRLRRPVVKLSKSFSKRRNGRI